MEEINFDIYGIKVKIKVNNSDFIKYLKKNYQYFLNGYYNKIRSAYKTKLTISIDLKHPYQKLPSKKNNYIQLGDAFYYSKDNEVFIREKPIFAKINLRQKKELLINGRFQESFLKHLGLSVKYPSEQVKLRYYHIAKKFFINMPLFYLLEKHNKMMFLHASAVGKERGLAFYGLGGSGKTTLGHILVENYSFNTYSDNYIILKYDQQRTLTKLFPFPEAMRISSKTFSFASPNQRQKSNSNKSLVYPKKLPKKEVKLKWLFLTSIGPKNKISKINSTKVINLISSSNDFMKENHYYHYPGLFNYINQQTVNREQRIKYLRKIVKSVRCYLIVSKDPSWITKKINWMYDNDIKKI